eukprot:CAMPEP_0172892020 /NCGR_PEP_ID=MMETSP1075-20121228/145296_1 /TAXON_ID=2916 /ORGANISM="Ceratium fusus, Strain PA161109" /LENGTH=73 /DNA_ID=CAMNT_0013746587 /DNA_START=8 /DNA_END=225 /DNA_ORIENTATION=-
MSHTNDFTLSAFIAANKQWLAKDELVKRLHSMPGLEPLRCIGNTQLEFAEFRDASAQNGTLAFRAAAAQNDIG